VRRPTPERSQRGERARPRPEAGLGEKVVQGSAARQDGSPLDGLAVVKADRAIALPRFKEIARGYDYVFLDGPPRLGDVTQSAAVAADVAVMPIQPGPFDFWAVAETLESIDQADQVRAQLGRPPIRRVFVLSRASTNTRLAREAEVDSYEADGRRRTIEAKCSAGERERFFLSSNERGTAERLREAYWIAWVGWASRLPAGPCDVAWFRDPARLWTGEGGPWRVSFEDAIVERVRDDSTHETKP
jgi:hypothetical protein